MYGILFLIFCQLWAINIGNILSVHMMDVCFWIQKVSTEDAFSIWLKLSTYLTCLFKQLYVFVKKLYLLKIALG